MAGITFSGLGSGIDTAALIKALVEVKRQPVVILQNQSDGFQSRLTKLDEFAGKLSALRTAVGSLALQTTFSAFNASSSNTDVMTVAASSIASEGSHTVSVTQLAQSQATRGVQTYGATNTALNLSGTLTLTPTGNPAAGDTITVTATDTLDGIRTKINNSGKATGTITFSAVPTDGTTMTVDGVTYEFTSGCLKSSSQRSVSPATGKTPDNNQFHRLSALGIPMHQPSGGERGSTRDLKGTNGRPNGC
jgi:flagellar hook-associated protein 2